MAPAPSRVKVFLTIDTEVWPASSGWPHKPLGATDACTRELSWYFYGGASSNARGVPYQLQTFANAGLKATYFVDPLFSYALGVAPLRAIVDVIREAGQEVGLHLHPEWLTDPRCHGLPAFAGPALHDYAEDDQVALIEAGLERLREVGADEVHAFRAGNWAASSATLRALKCNGIVFDTSLNAQSKASFPDIDATRRRAYTQPVQLEGVWEFPLTNFVDRPPGGWRPLNVCAASLDEFRNVLDHAHANQWFAVVIVLHSFEFVRVQNVASGTEAHSQRLLARRFEHLCDYLSQHVDRFETCHFSDLAEATIPVRAQPAPAQSTLPRTALRQIQQLASRLY